MLSMEHSEEAEDPALSLVDVELQDEVEAIGVLPLGRVITLMLIPRRIGVRSSFWSNACLEFILKANEPTQLTYSCPVLVEIVEPPIENLQLECWPTAEDFDLE